MVVLGTNRGIVSSATGTVSGSSCLVASSVALNVWKKSHSASASIIMQNLVTSSSSCGGGKKSRVQKTSWDCLECCECSFAWTVTTREAGLAMQAYLFSANRTQLKSQSPGQREVKLTKNIKTQWWLASSGPASLAPWPSCSSPSLHQQVCRYVTV
jgi:hypothetical protein